MQKAKLKYFINGEEVDGEFINWEYSTSITPRGDEIHVEYATEDVDNIYGMPLEDSRSIFSDMIDSLFLNGFFSSGEECCEGESLVDTSGSRASAPIEGIKYNKYKAPLDIVQTRQFPKALQALALATAFGNKKYADTDKDFLNFKRVEGGSQTYFDAAARHNVVRQEIDKDSGLPHIIHAVWDMMAALEISIEEQGLDIEDFSKFYLEYLHMSK